MGRYSYKLQPGATLAPNLAGLDPLTAPSAFNHGLRRELDALFVPGQAPRESQSSLAEEGASARDASMSHSAAAAAAEDAKAPIADRSMPATALSERIRASLNLLQRHTIGNAIPDLRSIHRRMPRLLGGTDREKAEASSIADQSTLEWVPILRSATNCCQQFVAQQFI